MNDIVCPCLSFPDDTAPVTMSALAVRSVLICSMSHQIAKLRELSQITFGRCVVEAKMADDSFCRNHLFIGHKSQNVDHFLCQRRLYRPHID